MKNRNEFGAFVQRYYRTGVGAEIGVRLGVFSRQIAKHWTGKILCVDRWPDEEVYEAAKYVLNFDPFVVLRGESVDIAKQVQDLSLDWVYLDADHERKAVEADLAAWYPKVRPGGLVAGHDYIVHPDFGVVEALSKFCANHGYTVSLVEEGTAGSDRWSNGLEYRTWWFQK